MDPTSRTAWTDTTIGDVIDIFDSKRIPLSGSQREQRQGQYPYYGASGIIDYIDDYIFDGRYLLIAEDGENLNSRKLPVAFFAKGKFWVNNHAHIVRAKDGVADDHFLFSWFAQANISGYITGAAQPKLSQSNLRCIELRLPPLPSQRKIASILSAYDDLIENNLRRIKILEEMSQNLYREWFVKFRFPGHEKVKMVDSPLGKIPDGWKIVAFTEIADVLSGGTPKTTVKSYWGGSIPFFAPKDAPESFYVTNTEKAITEIGLRKCNSKLYPKDTVFITARGTVGKVVMPSMDMAMNQSCYALRGRQGINQLYLFLATREQVDYLKKNTGGATFDTIVVDTFRRMLVIKPGNDVIVRFSQVIQPEMELILNILKKNTTLRRTRDLLLPKLISGELDVSELDITIPEGV